MKMEHTRACMLLYKAIEEDAKDKIFQKWLVILPYNDMSFDEYYQKHIPYRKSSQQEKDEILKKYGGIK